MRANMRPTLAQSMGVLTQPHTREREKTARKKLNTIHVVPPKMRVSVSRVSLSTTTQRRTDRRLFGGVR